MAEECEFRVRQIVWAKAAGHPWWPGRVKSIKQETNTIYCIHFFGDPSYCYLESEQLADFEKGLCTFADPSSRNWKLHRPIQLAKAACKKMQMLSISSNQHQHLENQRTSCLAEEYQERKMELKPAIENCQLTFQFTSLSNNQKITQQHSLERAAITPETVIKVLESRHFEQLKNKKGYNHRKQLSVLKESLKQTLLEKYRLDGNLTGARTATLVPKTIRKPTKILTRRKKGKFPASDGTVFRHCVKKLNRAIQRNLQGCQSRLFAIRMIEKAQKQNGQGTPEFRQMFKSMMLWANKNKPTQINNLQDYLCGMGNLRKQEEEKSKITETNPVLDYH